MRVEERPFSENGFEVGEWVVMGADGIVQVDQVDPNGYIWAWHNPLYWVTPAADITD